MTLALTLTPITDPLLLKCICCGGAMIVGRRRIPRVEMIFQPVPT